MKGLVLTIGAIVAALSLAYGLGIASASSSSATKVATACAAYWPPLIASGKPHAVTGAKQSLLGTTRRADGRRQVTYRHHPLYRFSGDTRKGVTSGQGLDDFGGEWWVVSPSGNKIVTGGSAGPGY